MQNLNKLFRPHSRPALLAVASLLWLPLSLGALAQTAEVTQTASTVAAVIPQQVRYAGVMPNRGGDTVEVTFKIYATAEGGEALWTESQLVPVSPDGTYSVLLGAASEAGLPQTVFAAGQARWVGVSIDRTEGTPRTPLTSVAYAMKAGDAESVGGLAATSLATKEDLAKLSQTVATAVVAPQVQVQPEDAPTGSGTADYVPLWTAAGTLGNSSIFQGSTGNIGIGTTTPGGPLEVSTGAVGGANSTMMLQQTSAASGNYYANIGLYNSNGLIGNLSALGAGYPGGQIFGANDVVFLGGQQHAATNLIMLTNTSGAIKFGTGGFTPGNERLRIGAGGGVSIGNGYVGTDPGAGNLIVSGKTGIGTATPAATLEVNGTAKFDGLMTFAAGQTFPGTGAGTITGITTTSPLTGSGTTGSVALGLNTSALETTLNGVYPQLGTNDTFKEQITFNRGIYALTALGSGFAATVGIGTNGSIGTYGSSDTGYGVEGASASGQGVVGNVATPAVGSEGVLGYTNSAFSTAYSAEAARDYAGVWGDSSAALAANDIPVGVFGTADTGYAGVFINNGPAAEALYVRNNTATGASINATGTAGDGLDVASTGANGIYAFAANPANGQAGVVGRAVSASTFAGIATYAGLWGDTGVNNDDIAFYATGVLGTADNGNAAEFYNDSNDYPTLDVYNSGSAGIGNAGTGSPRLFSTFMAGSANGTCGVSGGSMSCTGPIKSLASAGGSRKVETYAMQSPENWMEDFGSGNMVNGHATVSIDGAFAATVSGDASYHVFITPNGDSKGLYVTAKTANGFEVRESGGGTSSLSFDYRIVAKRAGYEGQRMVDVTETFAHETVRAKLAAAAHARPATEVRRHSPMDEAPNTPHRTIVPRPMPKMIVPQATTAPAHAATNK